MKKKINVITFLMVMLFSVASYAQTKDEAVNAYNKAVSLASTDLPQAVKAMIQSAEIAAQVGPEADTIKQMAQQQIPTLQYNYATALYKEKKIDEAITNFTLAKEYADQYADKSTSDKAGDLIPKLYLAKGVGEYKDSKFNEAVESYKKAVEFDSTMARAYLNMALAYKKLDNQADMKAAVDKAIEQGELTNDERTVENAKKTMSDDLLVDANNAFKKNDFNSAANLLEQAVQYSDKNPEIFYLYSVTLNKQSKWDEALAQVEKGLAIESNEPAKQARFYFEMGNAQAGKGDTASACASYKKAAVGPFAESANYQIKTVLKCN